MKVLLALVIVCIVYFFLCMSANKTLIAPDWHGKIDGLSYSPSGLFDEDDLNSISDSQIRRDLTIISKTSNQVRTYTVDRGLDSVPAIAREIGGLKVSLGIWLSDDHEYNDREINKAVKVINKNLDVITRVFVGNEVILRNELSAAEVIDYIKRVKEAIPASVEVGTAEVWSTWLLNPNLANESEFIGIHLLPYWEGIKSARAISYVSERMNTMQNAFPGRPIVIAEIGWPSEGRVKKGSVPSVELEEFFLRNFLHEAKKSKYDYYIIEAFDQPWKAVNEGSVGAYWGIFDADGLPKLDFSGELKSFPNWWIFALNAIVSIMIVGICVMTLLPHLSFNGYFVFAAIIGILTGCIQLILDAWMNQYADLISIISGLLLGPIVLFTSVMLLTETAELVVSLWRERYQARASRRMKTIPFVSIHVPTHNEPPLMVMQTINALTLLHYPNFEVIILDNNTNDESLWKPVKNFCSNLGSQFRFYHFDNMKGYKAGALNKCIELTDPRAEFIAVIDSDYQVAPDWLQEVMHVFEDENIALLQSPQDYRDASISGFKRFCYNEFAGFFHIGMIERNEHNAIIQHGTMCIIRRSALDKIGNWAEWCITEDTELGLRLLKAGYTARYLPKSLGRGVMPDTFSSYKTQRYRWVYGAMQILKRHAIDLILVGGEKKPVKLSLAQRYHFLAGWLPWIADGFALIFAGLSIIWSILVAVYPTDFDVPLTALSIVVITQFLIKVIKSMWLYQAKVKIEFLESIATSIVGLSLAYTVGTAVIAGLFTSDKPFLRTLKYDSPKLWTNVIVTARAEIVLLAGLSLAIAATFVSGSVQDPAGVAWIIALAVMAVPYASAVIVAISSGRSTSSVDTPSTHIEVEQTPKKVNLAA